MEAVTAFALYFMTGLGFLALFLALYLQLTPHAELRLIRAGNRAAAQALAGALLGFCLPLASAMAHSVSLQDLALWALVALVAQAAAYGLVRLLLDGFPARIQADERAAAQLAAAVHLGVGLLNAAAMTW